MIKVLHITARADLGGGPRHIQYLIESIDSNVSNFISCPADEPFYSIYSKLLGNNKLQLIPHRKFSVRAALALGRFVTSNSINLIHCHGKGAAVYGKFLKLLYSKLIIIYTPHGVNVSHYSGIKKAMYMAYEKFSSKLFRHLIFVSQSEAELALKLKLFGNVPYTIVSNGVPTFVKPSVDIAEIKKEIFGTDECNVVLTFSRFDHQKNMHEALEIALKLPHYNFLWVGNGDDFNELNLKIKLSDIKNVFMVGAQNNVKNYLALSDAYLSTARWEGMPLALLEAMSAGLPIVASNVVGNKSIVNNDTGYLYELGDVADAVRKLEETLENKFDTELIINSFQNRFSVEEMSKRISHLYKLNQK